MEMLGLQPGFYWGTAAGLSEFGGGTLLALGLLTPLGSVGALAAMTMATVKAHWGKPIWANKGGAELAVTYGAIALAVGLAGPGAYSLDQALGVRVPKPCRRPRARRPLIERKPEGVARVRGGLTHGGNAERTHGASPEDLSRFVHERAARRTTYD
jgi:hypothetical protein